MIPGPICRQNCRVALFLSTGSVHSPGMGMSRVTFEGIAILLCSLPRHGDVPETLRVGMLKTKFTPQAWGCPAEQAAECCPGAFTPQAWGCPATKFPDYKKLSVHSPGVGMSRVEPSRNRGPDCSLPRHMGMSRPLPPRQSAARRSLPRVGMSRSYACCAVTRCVFTPQAWGCRLCIAIGQRLLCSEYIFVLKI